MKIQDSLKAYQFGVSKVVSPDVTNARAFTQIESLDPPILKSALEVQRPSGIPQYRLVGTDWYRRIVKSSGTNGKGHTKSLALASALMEMVERYSCFKCLTEPEAFQLASIECMPSNGFQLEDLYASFVHESTARNLKNSEIKKVKIRWHKGYDLEGNPLLIPLNLITFLLEGTNGMAAGNSLEEAVLHALCEVVERHCLSLIELRQLRTPFLAPSSIRNGIALRLIDRFRRLKQPLWFKDFSLGIGLPVVGVIRATDQAHCIVTAGVAASPQEALIRALTENSQCEAPGSLEEIASLPHHFDATEIASMETLPDLRNKNIKVELERIRLCLERQGMKVCFVPTMDRQMGIPSTIAYISGTKFHHKELARRNILMALIRECIQTGQWDVAENLVVQGLKKDPGNKAAYSSLHGSILMGEKKYQEATRFLSRTLRERIPEAAFERICLLQLGTCHCALDQMDRASDYFARALEKNPGAFLEQLDVPFGDPEWEPQAGIGKASQLFKDIRSSRFRKPNAEQSALP